MKFVKYLVLFCFFQINADISLALAKELYIYAYPLVIAMVTKDIMTNVQSNKEDTGKAQAPINQFANASVLPTDKYTQIVRPNVDTLYSNAWLDLQNGPIILSVPDTHGRYYLLEVMDAWTNVFASIGKRTTGTQAQDFLFVGPDYKGKLPKNIKVIHAPTNIIWILGRTQTNGKSDYDAVHKIQAGYKLEPLSVSRFAPFAPMERSEWRGLTERHVRTDAYDLSRRSLGEGGAPVDQVDNMTAQEFYTKFAQELKINPPAKADKAILQKFKRIGLVPEAHERISTQDWQTLNKAIQEIKAKAKDRPKTMGKLVNGWDVILNIGKYGTDYLTRAIIARIGIGANLPEDAVYPTTYVDNNGEKLNGKNNYVIHFDKSEIPPVNAFWSITMYNSRSFLVKNPINRFALGDRDNLHFNKDGSLDIYIQNNAPDKIKESNWLPAPLEDFNLSMRLYWPKKSVLRRRWNPPAVVKVG